MTWAGHIVLVLLVGAFLPATATFTGHGDGFTGSTAPELRFSVGEGDSSNHFLRQNGISAHLNLRTYPTPRLVIAFPAGNSGAGLFFEEVTDGPVWGPVTDIRAIERRDEQGRILNGIRADIRVEAQEIAITEADVGSIRFLRNAVDYSALPPRGVPNIHIEGNTLVFSRQRPDGQSSYVMEVEVLKGELRTGEGIRFVAGRGEPVEIRVTAASGDPLEKPVAVDRLLVATGGEDRGLEESLAFLAYDTKLMAGSWRFLTYFGRDTLLASQLLMPVLTADAAEIGLGSVLERINRHGEVAHEEEIGELAVYRNMFEYGRATAEPRYDYDMIDDNLLLAPVLRDYVETFGRDRAGRFLSGRTSAAVPVRLQLVRNLQLVLTQSQAFADEPDREHLVAIKDGLNDGNWRDSEEGLVGGRYPYDVNAVLMPAALRAAAGIVDSGLLDDCAGSLPGTDELLRMADVWENNAAAFFEVPIPAEQATEKRVAYARENGFPPVDLPAEDVSFHAVALNAAFEPIPVMHSDTGFDLLFLRRPERHLAKLVSNLVRPFPAGLLTPVGVLAANPAFAGAGARSLVTRNHYHGTVIWSWQQAMIIAGLDRQLCRDDLSAMLRRDLQSARQAVWNGVTASRATLNSELWSFEARDNEFVIAPFGQSDAHLTESNAIQLWSTVFLALRPGAATHASICPERPAKSVD